MPMELNLTLQRGLEEVSFWGKSKTVKRGNSRRILVGTEKWKT